jgi:hypothetical protein
MMGWAAYLARPEFGWPLAVVLPLVMLSGGVIHVWGRRFGSPVASAAGLATAALPAWWSLRPVLEGSWEPASLEVAVNATAIGWVVVGLLLLALSGERLRDGNWSGRLPYGRGSVVGEVALGMLVLLPGAMSVLSNVGA